MEDPDTGLRSWFFMLRGPTSDLNGWDKLYGDDDVRTIDGAITFLSVHRQTSVTSANFYVGRGYADVGQFSTKKYQEVGGEEGVVYVKLKIVFALPGNV